ncbi:MAG: hypothetical protein EPO11_01365 [Gammaproteobacteria bacterium]|nr:MAG: hypothetical protein EPO11_01365 [Gammaproteobacteria bacterium]
MTKSTLIFQEVGALDQEAEVSEALKSLEALLKKFQDIDKELGEAKQLKEKERLAYEQAKLALLQDIEKFFDAQNDDQQKVLQSEQKQSSNIIRRISCRILSFSGAIMAGISGFCSSSALIAFVPFIVNPITWVVAGAFGVLLAFQSYCFDGQNIKKNLGVQTLGETTQKLINVHLQQIDAIGSIIAQVGFNINRDKLNYMERRLYGRVANVLDKSLEEKQRRFEHKENKFKKGGRWFLTGAISLTVGGGAFLGIKTFLTTILCASLLAGPWGLAIGAIAAVILVSLYLAVKSKGMYFQLNPAINNFQEVKRNLSISKKSYATTLDLVKTVRCREQPPLPTAAVVINPQPSSESQSTVEYHSSQDRALHPIPCP